MKCENPDKRKIVYFTGIDRVGKTTLRKLYSEITQIEGESDITFDRSPADNLVYDEAFRKIEFSDEYVRNYFKRFIAPGNVHIIFMELGFEEINKRYKNTEGGTYKLDELETVRQLFNKYLALAEKYGFNVVRLDCNNKLPIELLEETLQALKDE